jgi:hypothetical protein
LNEIYAVIGGFVEFGAETSPLLATLAEVSFF